MELWRSLISRHFSLSLLFLASKLEPAVGEEFVELIREDFLLGLLDFKLEGVLEDDDEEDTEDVVELGGGQKAFLEADFRLSRELNM